MGYGQKMYLTTSNDNSNSATNLQLETKKKKNGQQLKGQVQLLNGQPTTRTMQTTFQLQGHD